MLNMSTLLVLFSYLLDILDALDWDLELGLELGLHHHIYALSSSSDSLT